MRWLRTTDGSVTRPGPLALGLVAVLAFGLTFGLSRAVGDEGQERQAPAATTTADTGISLRSAAALPDLEAEPGPTEAELEAAREAREARAERRRKRKAAEERQAKLEAEQAEAEAEAREARRQRGAKRRRERAAAERAEREAEERAADERRLAQQRRLAEQRRREQAEREAREPPTTTPAPGGQEFDDSG